MDTVTTYVGKFACLLLLPMIVLVVIEVTRRYVFHSPTSWGMDASTFLYAASWALAGGYTLYQKKMVNMDVLYTRFSARGRALMDCATFGFVMLFGVIMFWYATTQAADSIGWREVLMGTWAAPYYPMRVVFAIGTFLILLQMVAGFIRNLYTIMGKADEH